MTVYCYDTEFLEDGSTINLISIGIVADDGREYYAVNSDMDYARIREHEWLCDNVVPHLPLTGPPYRDLGLWSFELDKRDTRVKPKWVIANEVRDFLVGDDVIPEDECAELWAYFGAYDHVALAQLFGPMVDLPQGLPMFTHELRQEMKRVGLKSTDVPRPIEGLHDALADARWNMAVLSALRGAGGAK